MDSVLKAVGVAVCVLFAALLIREKNRTLAALLSVGGACVLLASVFVPLRETVSRLRRIADAVPSGSEYLGLMLRVLAITLLTRLVSDICRENGENALAGVTEFCAKIAVTVLVLPIFETVITLVSGLIQ